MDNAQSAPADDFDPLQPEVFDSAHIEYARLRKECPVAHSSAWGGFWALMSHEDVRCAASDADNFTTTVQNVVPKVSFTGRRAPLHFDPPEHTPYRRALNQVLSTKRVDELEPVARRLASNLLKPLVERGSADICEEFSAVLPLQIFGQWMNLPDESLGRLRELAMQFNGAVKAADNDLMIKSSYDLYNLARSVVEERVKSPMDPAIDPTSALLASRFDGEPLPHEMIVGCVRQVLVVGLFAPMVTVGSIAVHLSRDQALQTQLRENPDQIPAAVEEFLRLYTAYRGFARTSRTDIEIGGREIKAGEPIALVFASANRDETVFPDGDKFIMNRPNLKEHVAFGRGPHNCPGANLGRMELRVAVSELLKHTSRFELNGEPIATAFPEMGALSVPLRLIA